MSEFEIQIAAAILIVLIFAVPVGMSRLIARRLGKVHGAWLLILIPTIAAILPIILLVLLALDQGGDPYGEVAIIGVAIVTFVIGLVLSGVTYSISENR